MKRLCRNPDGGACSRHDMQVCKYAVKVISHLDRTAESNAYLGRRVFEAEVNAQMGQSCWSFNRRGVPGETP